MLLRDFIAGARASLAAVYPAEEARAMVSFLCEDILGVKSHAHIIEPSIEVPDDRLPQLLESMSRLMRGEPLQYVTGHAEFCGFDFTVTPDVLIPRPETELLCRHAVEFVSRISRMRSSSGKFASPVRVLDLCTGSGCIAWTIALSVPGVEVVAVDISEKALEVARSQNFRDRMKADHDIKAPVFVHADVLDTETPFEYGPFDLITSNPPYVMESEKKLMERNVLEHEPAGALFVPDEDPLLYYRAISSWSLRSLAPDGMGLAELNEALAKQTGEIFAADGFAHISIVTDLNSKNRILRYSR